MSLILHPDPQEPAGGYGFLELPAGSLAADGVTVAVMDSYSERWLAPSEGDSNRIDIGDPNWQSERHEFGPYDVHAHDGADWVRIGPEIVNKIEEYTPLRIHVGGQGFDISWPDDLPPRAGAAVVGGIQTISKSKDGDKGPQLVGRRAPPEPEPEPEVDEPEETIVAPPAPPEPELQPDPGGKKTNWVLPLLLLLVVIGGAVWWFMLREDTPAPIKKETATITQEPEPSDPCSLATIRALEGGFPAMEKAIRGCGSEISLDTAFEVIEDFATKNDPAALLLFGKLYDNLAQDARIKDEIGLKLDADDTRAAEYYARAVKAGASGAQDLLSATCARLAGSNSTLAKGAYDDFCG